MKNRSFKNLPLNIRLVTLVGLLLLLTFSFLGGYIYTTNKDKLISTTDQSINNHLDELINIMEKEYEQTKNMITAAENISNFLLQNYKVGNFRDTTFEKLQGSLLRDSIHRIISKQDEDPFYNLKLSFYKKKYYDNGYAFLLSKGGNFIIHPKYEGENVRNTAFFRSIISNKHKSGKLIYKYSAKEKKPKLLYFKYYQPYEAYVGIVIYKEDLYGLLYKIRNTMILSALAGLIIFIIPLFLFAGKIENDFQHIISVLDSLAKGHRVKKIDHQRSDEVGMILDKLNGMVAYMRRNCSFSKELGKGNFDTEFSPLSREDELGNALLEMRENLKTANIENKKQKIIEEERNWIAQGLAKFADILRQNNDNLETLSYNVISNLVKYLNALQGGLFVVEKTDNGPVLEMKSCFAYDRRKFIEKQIKSGEGLVGMCYKEKETIYMTEIPEGYIDITSGLGDADPRSILIVPMKLNDKVYGCIEIASLEPFDNYKIEFVEKIGENIASTISSVRMNMETSRLLEKSQHQSEEMKNQEEELRQNMEELKATQEEAQRRENELKEILNAISKAIGTLELDMQGNIISVNDYYLQMAERSGSAFKGKNLSEFFYDTKENSFSNILTELSTGQSHTSKHDYVFNKNKKQFFESFTPIRNHEGVFSKILVMSYDVSEIQKTL